jgi:hypothetical protein
MKIPKSPKGKIKNQIPKTEKDEKQTPVEIEYFHHPRKVITCQGWKTPSCSGS